MQYSEGRLLTGAAMLFLFSCSVTNAAEVAIHSIVADPAKFDHQHVTLNGDVADLKEITSQAGNDYTTFKLGDGAGSALTTFMWGRQVLQNGEHVRVDGVFETVHHAGRYTFHNEIEATKIAPSP